MSTISLAIGSHVTCSDGPRGHLRRLVVDPLTGAVTHLVVETGRRHGHGHLVPIDLVDEAATRVGLRCTTEEFDALEPAEEERFVPGANGLWTYGQEQMLSWPYFCLDLEDVQMRGLTPAATASRTSVATQHRVPYGEVEIHRGDRVHAWDGDIGRVKGLIVDRADYAITHVLLDDGHLWGAKQVAIPIDSVTSLLDGVGLSLTKAQVADLPAVALDRR
jgi:hypothetical protein